MTDTLNLGVNDAYRDAINSASQRTGMAPSAIAAVVSAEAARGPHGVWNANSYNQASHAQGLTQFLPSTWLQMSRTPGTLLNQRSAGLSQQQILDLRTDPTLSITTAAEYDSSNLASLQRQGLVSQNLTPTQAAQDAYLTHHEGLGGASTILRGQMTDARARRLLPTQVGATRAQQLIDAAGGNAATAYTNWLNGYINTHIQPNQFTTNTPTNPPQLRGTLPAAPAPAAPAAPAAGSAGGGGGGGGGGPRVQDGEPTVLLGTDHMKAGHVKNPHEGGGTIKEGSATVLVGPNKLPMSRKGDATTDGGNVRGNTQPDVLVGGPPASSGSGGSSSSSWWNRLLFDPRSLFSTDPTAPAGH